ncbi:MAG: 3'-5' exonuclease [Campylobacterota bacterium]|nr:3'-5' exonuclease [Campylobacterota bacterium]
MNYKNKLVNILIKSPISIIQFNKILENSDTFFENTELETELLISNGMPLYFFDDMVGLKTLKTKLEDQVFCIVDIETTAGNAKDGQIIEIGAIKYKNNQIIETYESLVNTKEISLKIQELTGITPQMTQDAPNIKTVLEEFKIFLEDDLFVAHAISFDYKFISDSFKRFNLGELCNRRLCTIELAKRTIDCQRYGLKYLKEYLDINIDDHHRAYSDALSTQIVLEKCIKLLPDNINTTEELIEFTKI